MKEAVRLSDIGTIIVAVGKAAITALFGNGVYFGWYAIGLVIDYFGYLIFDIYIWLQEIHGLRKTGLKGEDWWLGAKR